MNSPIWTKTSYIKDRTQYWIKNGLQRRLAAECAAEDWQRYCEKYGYNAE